ncbi:hypothetical protein SUGI_0956080 [Cryptomeria japonica]|nr:hypothetical protein SUGI_0956080 [Cryptomeria japonica]
MFVSLALLTLNLTAKNHCLITFFETIFYFAVISSVPEAMETSPFNKRITIPTPKAKYLESRVITKEVLKNVFYMDCGRVEKAVRVVLGEDIL